MSDPELPADGDLLDAIERELVAARAEAARAVDRASALAELHEIALPTGHRLRRALRLSDLETDEDQRARVAALVARIRTDDEE